MKNLKLFCILFICALGLNLSYAQATKIDKKAAKAAEVKRIITSGSYVFKANYVIPTTMTPRYLTSDYDVTVTKDKLEVYLPYFGRAYAAPRDLNDGGIKLKTSNFSNVTVNKKGSWEITLKPTDSNPPGVKDVQVLQLTVNPDGYASLRVTSLNKQPISYNGYIEEFKKN
ncbi:DUF4251 domain-containing protein [Mucilaginibacter sp. UR6-11]|uniref:DUF4251 domain-containing protein n=1 Tax=Mucilaginibacter sp. UR6-11 TaxID=1435644 RepID=UPI001E2C9F30|nr:DUF4251 domain-containing protein [Mucilaginibacter sp. UR6-11]MCC8425909.1 DUF4251 domain-containing protein [Mucilaginibacter sp. UR6-11]